MTQSSLAAVMLSPRQTELRELPLPDVPLDAGLLRVLATGICGSDWSMYQSEKLGPRILGHEMVGTVVKLGSVAGDHWGVKEGDRVLFGKYSGTTVKVDGDELLVLREDDVMAVIA